MKILFITSHITNPIDSRFMRNQTGFGYMVNDIAKYVSLYGSVDLFVANTFSESIQIERVRIIGRRWLTYFKSLNIDTIYRGLKFLRKYPVSLKRGLRELYMYTTVCQLQKTIQSYDIVHIHGCSEITQSAIELCKKHNIPFLVTLHGLNSFEDSISLPQSLKQFEKDFLKTAADNLYNVSFISSGNKKMVEDFIGKEVESFKVICNGCNTDRVKSTVNVRAKFNIKPNDFVFAFVGNISKNKNQIQVARAWELLPESAKRNCKVLFVGRYNNDDDIVQYIKSHNLEDNMILCGGKRKSEVSAYYEACNATILTSLTEGFGLSIIEGYAYGKPNVTFEDLPATGDLYNKNAMVISHGRSDKDLALAMLHTIESDFSPNDIIKFAEKFSLEQMALNYVSIYKKIIEK